MADVAVLFKQKVAKLDEQRELASQMNGMLKLHLTPGSNLACKNLTAAISASKSPGTFAYYNASEEVKGIEGQKFLNGLARKIAKVHNELVSIDNEISLSTAKVTKRAVTDEPSPSSLSAWQQKYSTELDAVLYKKYDVKAPSSSAVGGMVSTFKPNGKIYGGTSHHKSFKTTSSQLIKGRCTR